MTNLIINHWGPKNSNLNRCYFSNEEGEKLGYIQYFTNDEHDLVCDDYWDTAKIKVEGDKILEKVIKLAKKEKYNIGAFMTQFARNALLIGNKAQVLAQKSRFLTI